MTLEAPLHQSLTCPECKSVENLPFKTSRRVVWQCSRCGVSHVVNLQMTVHVAVTYHTINPPLDDDRRTS